MKKKELRKKLDSLENQKLVKKMRRDKRCFFYQVEIDEIRKFLKARQVKDIIDKIKLIEGVLLKNNKKLPSKSELINLPIDLYKNSPNRKEWAFLKPVLAKQIKNYRRIYRIGDLLDGVFLLNLIVLSLDVKEKKRSVFSVKEYLSLSLESLERFENSPVSESQKMDFLVQCFKEMDLREILNEAII